MLVFLHNLIRFCKNYKFSLIFFIYLFLLASNTVSGVLGKSFLLNSLSLIILLFLLSRIKNLLGVFISLLLSLIISLDAYFSIIYGTYISTEAVASIFETNKEEALSMIGSDFFKGLLIFIMTIGLTLLSRRELKKCTISIKIPVIIVLLYLILFLPAISYRRIKAEFKETELKTETLYISQYYVNCYSPVFWGNILAVISYINEVQKIKKYIKKERIIPEGIIWKNADNIPHKIYFIIGESSLRDNYSLYGYEQITTPFLDSLKNENKLSYYHGIAPASLTREALRIALTFASPLNLKPFYENKNVIDLADNAGYETIWLANTTRLGLYDTPISFISNSARIRKYYEKGGGKYVDDLNLISELDVEYKKEKSQFFVLHLVGSHMNYMDKYDERDKEAISGENSPLNNYNRSIHHTDRVLREVYNIAQRDSSYLIYYFSDHAEIIGKGHGIWLGGNAQYRVPLVVISSNQLYSDSIISKYIDTESSHINTSSNIYIMSELIGYKIPENYIEKSLTDGKYIRQVVNGDTYLYSDIPDDLYIIK